MPPSSILLNFSLSSAKDLHLLVAKYQDIGDALLKEVIAHAKNHVKQLHLTVVTTNQVALKLYQKNGFKIYGTEPRSLKIADQYYDEYLMVLEL